MTDISARFYTKAPQIIAAKFSCSAQPIPHGHSLINLIHLCFVLLESVPKIHHPWKTSAIKEFGYEETVACTHHSRLLCDHIVRGKKRSRDQRRRWIPVERDSLYACQVRTRNPSAAPMQCESPDLRPSCHNVERWRIHRAHVGFSRLWRQQERRVYRLRVSAAEDSGEMAV